MRKLLTILFLFLAFFVKAQKGIDTPPLTDLLQNPIKTYSMYLHTPDSTVWQYLGNSKWKRMFRAWKVMTADSVVTRIYDADTLNISGYKLIADSLLAEGYATNYRLQHKIDSLYTLTYRHIYEIEVSTDGVSTYSVPFTLRTNSMIFYNGNLTFSNLWWGSGTTSLVIGYDTHVKDKIIIQN